MSPNIIAFFWCLAELISSVFAFDNYKDNKEADIVYYDR